MTGWGLLLRLAREHLPSQALWMALGVACMLGVAGATAAIAWLMEPAFNQVFVGGNRDTLVWLGLAFPVVFVTKGLANYGQRTFMNRVGLEIVARYRRALYDHLLGMDIAFLGTQRTADLVTRFTVDLTMLKNTITSATMALGRDIATLLGLVGTLVALDPTLAALALALFPVAGVPIFLMGRAARNAVRGMQSESGRLDGVVIQALGGLRVVRLFGGQAFEEARVGATLDLIHRHMMRTERLAASLSMGLEILSGVVFAGVVVYGGLRVSEGSLLPGTFFAFVTSVFLLYQPMKRLGKINVVTQEGISALERTYAILDARPTLQDPPNAPDLRVTGGEIVFDRVRLTYPGEDHPALEDLSVRLAPGQTAALVGPSGAGKSSALALLARFRDPDQGQIRLDGQDIKTVSLRSLWASLAVVTQDVVLFDDTVLANIAYGRPGAPREAVIEAAEAAGAHTFISALPQGYDTVIGEEGATLSGGQRQRLMLARAFLKDAPILILDEATSALDPESERGVRQAFDRVRTGRTCLVIAHRLATVRNADVIHVLDQGRIIASGRHDTLLTSCPLYARLCASGTLEA
ncbi:ABC transporter ATP-binding protein [Pararhodospirillum photometricum]|uniref:ABC transporter, transmembrane region n=1 Tax=Pararhodospirillum photometricum DSM 122 TaxID=1150469 RepID=H6SKL8_PARPM|nr:ABC transporter ATP-binding protein [Pararhodospirillum photometricum]CCG08533.1 ABC transporter, transmembrane region [Pararhodospirillum photometricum DSM 122]